MEQNSYSRNNSPLSLAEVLGMFKGKLKIFVALILVTAIVAAALSFILLNVNAKYGATLTFYLTPGDSTNALLSLLQSESFSEKLLLDSNGLPPKDECDPDDYDAAMAAINELNAARIEKRELRKELDFLPSEIAVITEKHRELLDVYNRAYELLDSYLSLPSDGMINSERLSLISECERQLSAASAELHEYEETVYNPALQRQSELNDEYTKVSRRVLDARANAERLTEVVVAPWRNSASVRKSIKQIQSSVTFEYLKFDEAKIEYDEKNINAAFLIVTVSLSKDESIANEIFEALKERTPSYVEYNIERLVGSTEPKCSLLTPYSDSHNLNRDDLVSKVIVITILAVVVMFLLICLVVIVLGTAKRSSSEPLSNDTESNKSNKQ